MHVRTYGKIRPLSWLNWWSILAISLVVAVYGGFVAAQYLPTRFTVTSSFLFNNQTDLVSSLMENAGGLALPKGVSLEALNPNMETINALLVSRALRQIIVRKYRLAERWNIDEELAIERLAQMTRIAAIGATGLSITVSCWGARHPLRNGWFGYPLITDQARALCADLANAYPAELNAYITNTNRGRATANRIFIQQRQNEIRDRLRQVEDALAQLQSQHQMIDAQGKAAQIVDRVNTVEKAYADAQAQLEDNASSLNAARGRLRNVDAVRVSQEVTARNPVISTLEEKIAQLQVDLLTEKSQGKTDQNRDVQRIQVAINGARQQIHNVAQEVRESITEASNPTYDEVMSKVVTLGVTLAGLQARTRKYGQLLHQAKREMADLPAVAREYATLKREQDIQIQLLDPISKSLGVSMIAERHDFGSRFIMLDKAAPPPHGFGPALAAVFCALLVFALCAVILWWIAWLRRIH